jgi:hypothetical protein
MSHKAKNILIAFLFGVIALLFWMLYVQSYGSYCKPIVREVEHAPEFNIKDSSNLPAHPE